METQAQEDARSKINLDDIEVSILGSYYMQDGNHSPVTGGQGTEKLMNIAPSIVVNVPIDTAHGVSLSGGVDFYSSASSDNINNPYLSDKHVSSASASDQRYYATLGYHYKHSKSNTVSGVSIGFSKEFDVISLQAGASFQKSSRDHNRDISFKASYYKDEWKLIYPVELRNGNVHWLSTNQRHTVNLSTTGSFVLTKRVQTSVTVDMAYQFGMLSTPFHRVYFRDHPRVKVEQLPGSRLKIPVGLRLNIAITDYLFIRSHYRFYWDTWSLIGNTVTIEIPVVIARTISLYPFYRFHQQFGTPYFMAKGEHSVTDEFYTCDYDLSTLNSHKYGIGISISPLMGVLHWKGLFRRQKVSMLKSIDLRYARYDRSDGLRANVWTLGLNFTIDR
ncbi:MAG: DUF3570 domain-containing protein [Flavobacteriales bacterium]|nr:DUF3570 domain-containing protein [Flavobacteriales bacterium]